MRQVNAWRVAGVADPGYSFNGNIFGQGTLQSVFQ